ncbi:MAG: hypothetical protein Q8M24_11165 [Pseudolabrys sp.]|nr:hypothetical protein [Pseudolabrys sp.]MDP2296006.1 hypothetical protein [Pseudolabrys sp.]
MTIAITISVLTGIAIGFRFKIYMVVPAVLAAAISTVAVSVAQGDQFWSIVAALTLTAIALQVGYLCGSFAVSMKEAPVTDVVQAAASPAPAYRSRNGLSA